MRRVVFAAWLAVSALGGPAAWAATERVDVALVLAIDESGSVDDERFALQMRGIAAAFASREVRAGILSGPNHAMLVGVVQWSNRPRLSVPWTLLTDDEGVERFAARVRDLRRDDNAFTCMSRALRNVADKVLTQQPLPADRVIVDVSGDGRDNCNLPETVDQVRDELALADVTVNGLPILEGNEAATLEAWYREHVIGGPSAFLLPAMGFADFERAMRRKFVTEISAVRPPCTGAPRDCPRFAAATVVVQAHGRSRPP